MRLCRPKSVHSTVVEDVVHRGGLYVSCGARRTPKYSGCGTPSSQVHFPGHSRQKDQEEQSVPRHGSSEVAATEHSLVALSRRLGTELVIWITTFALAGQQRQYQFCDPRWGGSLFQTILCRSLVPSVLVTMAAKALTGWGASGPIHSHLYTLPPLKTMVCAL